VACIDSEDIIVSFTSVALKVVSNWGSNLSCGDSDLAISRLSSTRDSDAFSERNAGTFSINFASSAK